LASTFIFQPSLFSVDDDRWPLVPALVWIATRSLAFAEAFADREPSDADALLWSARHHGGMPPGNTLGEAFNSLCQKIESGEIHGLATRLKWLIPPEHETATPEKYFAVAPPPEADPACDFRPQALKNQMVGGDPSLHLQDFVFHDGDCLTPKGFGYGSPNLNGSRVRWSWRAPTFARDDLFKIWPDWPVFAAWKQAKAHPWCPPEGLAPEWLNFLSAGQYAPLAEVVNLLAFGIDCLPIGLDAETEHVARLSSGLALFSVVAEGKVGLIGHATFRLPHHLHGVAPVAALWKIEPGDSRDMTLVLDGATDWIGPRKYADEYPELGQATESVSYVGVAVHRDSLRRWFHKLSDKSAPQKRGRKPEYDWLSIQAEALRLMDYHGEFSPDDRDWNAQACLESALLEYCSQKWDREPSLGQLRHYLAIWLRDWRKKKK
jgi:hypothetical protein